MTGRYLGTRIDECLLALLLLRRLLPLALEYNAGVSRGTVARAVPARCSAPTRDLGSALG